MPLTVNSSNDLQPGDLLLKHFQALSPSNLTAIVPGSGLQSVLRGGRADLTHAALYIGGPGKMTVEAMGSGLGSNPITSMPHKYLVYRFTNAPNLAAKVRELALKYLMQRTAQASFGKYSVPKGLKGMLLHRSSLGNAGTQALMDVYQEDSQGWLSPKMKFYCSNFAVLVYNLASLYTNTSPVAIQGDFRHITPNAISAILAKDQRWDHTGHFVCFKNN